jgi:nanoRNase/pAp phosphatase (c-di-AMP/oligoRNAs hydrolase)
VTKSKRSERLCAALKGHDSLLIVTHDNPDPDAIASGWGVLTLVRECLKVPARLVAGGAVVRAENRRMIELLQPPVEFVTSIEPPPGGAVVLVDCVPTAANHMFGNQAVKPVAVIDHHQPDGPRFRVPYRDIRPHVAATSTIAGEYLRELGREPGAALATALTYGIRTDAFGRADFSRTDQRILSWLSRFASQKHLADIECAPLHRGYYADMLLAMETTFLYGDAALCFLPQASSPEIVGEVADLLIRCEGVERVLCAAVVEQNVFLSARTTENAGDASQLIRVTLDGIGHGGGHRQRSGGRIPIPENPGQFQEGLQAELRARWLKACGNDQQRGTRLVARQAIAKHL